MKDVLRTGVRLAGLLAIAVCIAHCGDNDVHIRTGGGVSPSPGTFVGSTDEGEPITRQPQAIPSRATMPNGSS